MAELKCAAESCTYNKEKLCCKGDICVGGHHAHEENDTCCESFVQKREGQDAFTNALAPDKRISIDCEAVKCVYNSNCKCVAEHVDIKGSGACDSGDTACATFKER